MRRELAVAVWVMEPGARNRKKDRSGKKKRSGRAASRTKISSGNVSAIRRALRQAADRMGMDITWLTEQIALGGGIWNEDNMAKVAKSGITHIIDMQIEFDDTPLAEEHGIQVLWNPTDDDFEPKRADLFERGVEFAEAALDEKDAKLYIHCAAGVHRAPMMALAVLCRMGWKMEDAMGLIVMKRPVADFADVYVVSVKKFLNGR